METDLKRIKKHIKKINSFNSTPEEGITRFSYSEEDKRARSYLTKQMEELGLDVRIDSIGNIRARLEGSNPKAPIVMTGSHIDTVLHGGRFDGTAGVIGGLEAITVLVENKVKLYNPVELIIFVEEEGGHFGSALVGSKALIGETSVADLKKFKNQEGISMYRAARDFGLNPDELDKSILEPGEVKAMIEMHIEQSVVLDTEDIPIGVVQAVAGRKWIKVEIKGVANHAGATPMDYRQDSMVGAADIISALNRIVNEGPFDSTVGTVGRIACHPNEPNVIPARVNFIVEIRDVEAEGIEITVERLEKELECVCRAYGLEYTTELMSQTEPIELSSYVKEIIEDVVQENKIAYKKINSGALHDACVLANITETGMIFLPSIDGRSHAPEEETDFEDIKLGSDVLLETIIKLASKSN